MPITEVAFLFLGTGTSAGVPVIACDCDVCRSDDPRDQRTRCGACLRFRDNDGHHRVILIDATPDLRQQVLRHGIDRCDAIFFTHNHVDHTFGLDDVRRFNAVMQSPIDIYSDEHTMQTLFRVYRHIFEKHRNVNDSFVATLIPHVIVPGDTVELYGLRFEPVRLLHGRLPVLGYRIEETARENDVPHTSSNDLGGDILPLGYCTDVSSIPPETWPRLTGLKTLVLDMLRFRAHPTHMTVEQAVEAADEIAAHRTFFTHMTHDILHREVDAALPATMSLAYDGLVLGAGEPNAPSRGVIE